MESAHLVLAAIDFLTILQRGGPWRNFTDATYLLYFRSQIE